MNQRLRIDPVIAYEAGTEDARQLIAELCNPAGGKGPEDALCESLGECIGLAVEMRTEEAAARLAGFVAIVAPMLAEHCNQAEPELVRSSAACALEPRFTETEGGEL